MPQLARLRPFGNSVSDSISCSAPWRPTSSICNAVAFSTSCIREAAVAKKGSGSRVPTQVKKGQKNLVLKKKGPITSGRPPAPGERKASRKRIVVSNTNALPVPGLQEVSQDGMARAECEGEMMTIPGATIDSLRAVEAFKPTQGWSLFNRPATVWRRETVALAELMNTIHSGGKMTSRKLLFGPKGSGKSVLQLQAMAMAFTKGWVVINLPDAQDITNAGTEYEPVPETDPTKYIQKTYMAKLLQQLIKANSVVLSSLQMSQNHNLPIEIDANANLLRLTQLGANTPDLAWPVFQAVWSELMSQPSGAEGRRPPVLLAIDGIEHAMRESKYRSAEFESVHAHDLAIIDFFNTYLSGSKPLSNGGLVIAASSQSNRPESDALDYAVQVNQQAQHPEKSESGPTWSPYRKLDTRVMEAMRGVEILKLGGLNKNEAKGIMSYYAASGILRQAVTDTLVTEKWALSSGGIVGELEKNSVVWRM